MASGASEIEMLCDRLREALETRSEILEAYLHGSHAREQARAHSDIDVAVFVASEAPDSTFGIDAEITADLMRALGVRQVDVTILNHAGPLLYHRVLRDGIRLFSRNETETTTREGRALSRYCDYVPQLAKIRAASTGRLRAGDLGT